MPLYSGLCTDRTELAVLAEIIHHSTRLDFFLGSIATSDAAGVQMRQRIRTVRKASQEASQV